MLRCLGLPRFRGVSPTRNSNRAVGIAAVKLSLFLFGVWRVVNLSASLVTNFRTMVMFPQAAAICDLRHFRIVGSPSHIVIETHEQILADPLFSQVCGRLDQEGCCQEADPGDYIDSINARSASGLRIMVQRFFNSMMP